MTCHQLSYISHWKRVRDRLRKTTPSFKAPTPPPGSLSRPLAASLGSSAALLLACLWEAGGGFICLQAHQAPAAQPLSGPALDRLAFLLALYQEFLHPSLPECMFPIMRFFLNWLNKTAGLEKRLGHCRAHGYRMEQGLRWIPSKPAAERTPHISFLCLVFSPFARQAGLLWGNGSPVVTASWVLAGGRRGYGPPPPPPANTPLLFQENFE